MAFLGFLVSGGVSEERYEMILPRINATFYPLFPDLASARERTEGCDGQIT